MDLVDKIIAAYPELAITPEHDEFAYGSIELRDDGDGIAYINRWNYLKPLPAGMKIGK